MPGPELDPPFPRAKIGTGYFFGRGLTDRIREPAGDSRCSSAVTAPPGLSPT